MTSVRGASYALAILCFVAFLSQLDRNLTVIIVTPLKQTFGISDSEFGLLHGYGFALTYAVFGLPFGRLVDRRNRRNLIAVALLTWSLLTMMSAFATSYIQLLLLRTGVGIGEAVLAPAAYSLLIDYFEPARRGRATSIYFMSTAVGGGASLMLGGLLLSLLSPSGLSLAGMISLEPWRLLFLFAGLPGIFGALVMFTVREPSRRGSVALENASIRAFLRYIWHHKLVLGLISIASTLVAMAGYGTAAWTPALLERKFGIPASSAAFPIGCAMILGSIGGTLISGYLSDRNLARSRSGARTRPMLIGYIALLPAAFIGLSPAPWLVVILFAVILFSVGVIQSAMPLALQEAVPANMRGQILALQLLIMGLCSIGFGPTIVGVINDALSPDGDLLGWSLLLVLLPITFIGLAVCAFGLNRSPIRPADADTEVDGAGDRVSERTDPDGLLGKGFEAGRV